MAGTVSGFLFAMESCRICAWQARGAGGVCPPPTGLCAWDYVLLVLDIAGLIAVTCNLLCCMLRAGVFKEVRGGGSKMVDSQQTQSDGEPQQVSATKMDLVPSSPSVADPSLADAEGPSCPASPTPVSPPGPVADPDQYAGRFKCGWKDFCSMFRHRDVAVPFPELESAETVPEADVDELLRDDGLNVKGWLALCRSPEERRRIAKAFLDRFPKPAEEWDAAGALMTADENTSYWVAGDVHAKVDAIAKICAVIQDCWRHRRTKDRNVLILLGDYVDRGDEPLETLAFIERLKLEPLFDGFEVVTLKGNHDVGLSRDGTGRYVSMVSPAETAELLQTRWEAGEDLSVEADAAMRLADVSPRMCELTGIDRKDRSRTMLFVHGGVPHVDLQESLYEVQGMFPQGEPFFKALGCSEVPEELRRRCAEDFTWIRFARDLPLKTPNRGSRGCEIGTEDVAQYLFLHRALTSRSITFIFRGHDHERPGFACYSVHPELNPTKKKFAQRECHVLTLNAMEPDYSSGGMFRERDLALAEWTMDGPVKLHRVATRHLEVQRPGMDGATQAQGVSEDAQGMTETTSFVPRNDDMPCEIPQEGVSSKDGPPVPTVPEEGDEPVESEMK